jgi:asparagine synthase (glutamine-hydrolysing)
MPSVVGVVSRRRKDVSDVVAEMLSTLKHRGPDYMGAAIGGEVVFSKNMDTIDFSGCKGDIALGFNGFDDREEASYQPLTDCTSSLYGVFDGRIFNSQKLMGKLASHEFDASVEGAVLLHSVEEENRNLHESVSSVMHRVDGVYAFAVMRENKIALTRDPVGIRTLYWGENDSVFAFASERKALWKIGVKKAEAFPPGNVAVISSEKREVYPSMLLKTPVQLDVEFDTAAMRLLKTLKRAVEKRVEGIGNVGLLFSGGIDSYLLGKLLKDLDRSVQLFTVGVEESYDVEAAEKAAALLQLPLSVKTISHDDVEKLLPRVMYSVEECDRMKIGVALPLYAACEEAYSHGFRAIFTGQGSDELFGGYSRYLSTLKKRGYDALNLELWLDLLDTHNVNLNRDSAVAASHGLDLFLPYLDLELVHLASSFPPQYKVEDGSDRLRKRVLRRAAELQGVQRDIVVLPKKAVQYGSGVDRAIRRVAKTHGYRSVKSYLRSVFRDVFRDS